MSNEYETWKAYAENLQAQRENDAATIEELLEALGRVETERDLLLQHNNGRIAEERDTAQAQLAEAVEVLRSIRQDLTDSGSISQVDAFLALATQPAAGEPVATGDAIKVLADAKSRLALAAGANAKNAGLWKRNVNDAAWRINTAIELLSAPPAAAHGEGQV